MPEDLIRDVIAADRDLERLGLDPYTLVYFDQRNYDRARYRVICDRIALIYSGFTIDEIRALERLAGA